MRYLSAIRGMMLVAIKRASVSPDSPTRVSAKASLKRPPMRRVFASNFLDGGMRPRKRLRTNGDVAKYLMRLALADLGGVPVTGPDPVSDERIARMMAMEAI